MNNMAKTIIKIDAIPNTYWEFAEATLFHKRYSRLYVKGEYSCDSCHSYDNQSDWDSDMEQVKSLESFLNVCGYRCEELSLSEEKATQSEEFKTCIRLLKTAYIKLYGTYPNQNIYFEISYPLFQMNLSTEQEKINCKSVKIDCASHTIEFFGEKDSSDFIRLKKNLPNELFSVIRKSIRAAYLLTIERQKRWYNIVSFDDIIKEAKQAELLK